MSSGDRKLPLNRRQHVFPNGTLLIENVQRAGDHGLYTCTATNKQHLAASQTVSLSVIGECVLEQRTDTPCVYVQTGCWQIYRPIYFASERLGVIYRRPPD